MKKTILCLASLMCLNGICADRLELTSTGTSEPLKDNDRIRLKLTLDQPADEAWVEFQDGVLRPAYLNGGRTVALAPSSDRKTFQAEIALHGFYSPTLVSGKELPKNTLTFLPAIRRDQARIPLKGEKMPWTFQPSDPVMRAGEVLLGEGKFGKAFVFDGKSAMAAVNKFNFNPERGTVEAWVFFPLLLNKNEQVVFTVVSADKTPWCYQSLLIPPNTRKLKYVVYGGIQHAKPVREIVSKEIPDEDWVHVAVNYDLAAKKMELLVNGKSQGTTSYDFPAGGRIADLMIGARYHNKKKDYDIMFLAQMMIDEIRISDSVRPALPLPDKEFTKDDNTLLLLHCEN